MIPRCSYCGLFDHTSHCKTCGRAAPCYACSTTSSVSYDVELPPETMRSRAKQWADDMLEGLRLVETQIP